MAHAATLTPPPGRTGFAAESRRVGPLARHPIGLFLVNVYLVGLYTFVSVDVLPGPPLPGLVAAGAGWLLVFKNADQLRWSLVWPLLGYFGTVVLGTLVAPEALSFFGERAKSLIYLAYSLSGALGVVLELGRWERRDVARLFGAWAVAIVIGCALELYGGLRPVSDAFRDRFFAEKSDFAESERDLILFGQVRPKFFTSEPAYVAKFVLLAGAIWLALTGMRRKYLAFALLNAAALVLIRSPTMLMAAGFGVANYVFIEPGGWRRFVRSGSLGRTLRFGLAVFVAALIAGVMMFRVLGERLDRVAAGTDVSVIRRLFSPVYVTREALSRYPLRGIGVGGEPAVADMYADAYASIGMDYSVISGTMTLKMFNFGWQHWIYLGLGFGLVALLFLVLFARRMGVRSGAYCVIGIFLFSNAMGGYVGIRVWSYVLLILLVGVMAPRLERPFTSARPRSGAPLPDGRA